VKRAALLVPVIAVAIVVAALVWWHHRAPAGTTERVGDLPSGLPVPNLAVTAGDPQAPLPALADDDPPGALRLEGLVLGPDDHPVAGATVTLGSSPPRTAVSDAGGSFAFDGLVARAYRLVARAPAGVAGPVVAQLTDKSEPVVLRLRGGAKLTVSIVGIDGKPIDGAMVELRGDDRQTTRSEHGEALFSPIIKGFYRVEASAPGLAPATQQIRVTGETRARLVLLPGASVSGRVVDEQNKPVAGARVVYVSNGQLFAAPDWRLDAVVTGSDGSWRFAALAAGSYRFLASDADHATGTSALVAVDGATEKTGVAIALPPGAVVRGRVVDTGKQPVAGARVQVGLEQRGRGQRQVPRQAYSDAQGEFVVRGLPRDHLVVSAQHEKGASNPISIDATSGEAKDVAITLDLTAIIAGTVVDDAGEPIEGAQVTAASAMRGSGFVESGTPSAGGPTLFARGGGMGTALTDAGGRFRITGLAEGAYNVRATRSGASRGGRRRGGDGVDAHTGDEKVKIVLPAEGAVKAKVVFADGHAPQMFTASIGAESQVFLAGELALAAIAPGDYRLEVSGPSFDSRAQDLTISPGQTTDLGTIVVQAGRRIAGVVVSHGQPVAGATVYAGPQVLGGGASNDTPMRGLGNLFGGGSKQDTTDASGAFALAGFGEGDLTVVADLPGAGRSTPRRVTEDAQDQLTLTLELLPYGSISGSLVQGGQPAAGVMVTSQSTSTPGAVYMVQAGSDGAYRFDQLAPDTYKVSALLGNLRRGMQLYSKQVDVPQGQDVRVDLVVDTGTITLDVTAVAAKLGIVISYLSSKPISAANANQLSLQLAAAGPGTSQVAIARSGAATFTEVQPGDYTTCLVPLPPDLRGGAALGYVQQHGQKLAAFCKAVTVAATPTTQEIDVPVTVPPPTGTGSGSAR
jgi:protocatechuate 3,4-dioxygenase beta subunit